MVLSTADGSRDEWVLSRGLCLFRCFRLRDIPPARRASALDLKLRQWCPFPDFGSHVVWQGETAQAWVWNREVAEQAANGAGIRPRRILPETVCYPVAERDGVRLLEAMDGVEAQIWADGVLMGSHWWAEQPESGEWVRFQRAHGLKPDATLPEPQSTGMLERSWGRAPGIPGRELLRSERFWVTVGAAVLITLLIWQLIALQLWRNAIHTTQERIEELSRQADTVLAIRTRTLEDRAMVERLAALDPYATQLELLAAVAGQLAGTGARLLAWQYEDGHLSFTLETENPDPRAFVKTYQSMQEFSEVTAEPGRRSGELVLSMIVNPRSARP